MLAPPTPARIERGSGVKTKPREGWELQWQPAGGGPTRRFVLGWQGMRNLMLAFGFLFLLLVGGGVAVAREEYRIHESVGAAELENGFLKARQDALRDRAAALLGRLETLDDEHSRRAGDNSL